MSSKVGMGVCGALSAGTLAAALVHGALAAALPRAVAFWGMPPDALATRPAALGWTTDLGPSFNGDRGSDSGRGPSSNLSWSSWGASGASGSGDLWVPREKGVSISWTRYAAALRFSAPDTLSFATAQDSGADKPSLVYTRVEVSFTSAVPAGWQRSASFALKRSSQGFYGFVFPR
jgi:hypothetical protein